VSLIDRELEIFVRHWIHDGALQTFADRERFREQARKLLAQRADAPEANPDSKWSMDYGGGPAPKVEPVAWAHKDNSLWMIPASAHHGEQEESYTIPLYAHPPSGVTVPVDDMSAVVSALDDAARWIKGDKWRDGDAIQQAAWQKINDNIANGYRLATAMLAAAKEGKSGT